MKRRTNYVMAALVFVLTMVIMNMSAVIISSFAVLVGTRAEGAQGGYDAAQFLMNNLNFYTCLIYVITGSVFVLWYYFAFVEKKGISMYMAEQTRKLKGADFGWIALLTLAVQHAVSLILTLIGILLPSSMENYTEMIETSGVSDYSLLWVIGTVILPPIVEETIFRGLIYRYMRRAGLAFLAANLVQAVLFGLFHMNLVQGIYAACLGFLLGYLAYRYDSILIPIAMHSMFNLCGTVVVELENRFLPGVLIGFLILVSIPATVFLLMKIYRETEEKIAGAGYGPPEEHAGAEKAAGSGEEGANMPTVIPDSNTGTRQEDEQ